MSEWRYHLLFGLGGWISRAGQRLIDAAEFDPCQCERERLEALIKKFGSPTNLTTTTIWPATSSLSAGSSFTFRY